MNVAAFTRGVNAPSARMRIRQHIAGLASEGIAIREFPLRWGWALPARKRDRLPWLAATFGARLYETAACRNADLVLVQKHLLPGLLPLEQLLPRPRVLDFDDAVWLTPRGNGFPSLLGRFETIICGNTYLANYARQWNSNVVIIPTAVDTTRFVPSLSIPHENSYVIGWSGMSVNLRYMYQIEEALALVLSRHPHATLRIVCDAPPHFRRLPSSRVEFIPWSVDSEINALRTMSVGLMPLDDTPWSQGKCSFKMLCYMSVGIPVVVSPVGMNSDVLKLGKLGFAATHSSHWVECLCELASNPTLRHEMGSEGRRVAIEHFSLEQVTSLLSKVLRNVKR